ncbi:MAG: hypothetical protein PHH57_08050 [Candidatus Omnitrophica bacterium]|nr:hypothetical protein [Candidatus Omnitrophota bacterium]
MLAKSWAGERNRDVYRAANRKRHHDRKVAVFEKLGGVVCVNCGCDEIDFLEINHKDGGGCAELRKINRSLYEDIYYGRRGTEDLEVLCRVCNALDHLKRKSNGKTAPYRIIWQDFTGKKADLINGP